MQIYADVTEMPLSWSVPAGARARIGHPRGRRCRCISGHPAAAAGDGPTNSERLPPIPENVAAYDELYAEYRRLHDYFGRGENDVMHRLRALDAPAVTAIDRAHEIDAEALR